MTTKNPLKNWNYRVIKHHSEQGDYFEIHEVYYDDQGIPMACSEQPAVPYGDTIEDLSACMIHMQSALTQSVLDVKIFVNTTNNTQSIHSALDIMKNRTDV